MREGKKDICCLVLGGRFEAFPDTCIPPVFCQPSLGLQIFPLFLTLQDPIPRATNAQEKIYIYIYIYIEKSKR